MSEKRFVLGRWARRARAGLVAFSIALPAATALGVAPAHAEFRVCNEAEGMVGVALGYRGEDGWVSEGWWLVPGNECQVLVNGTLTSRYYYLYAENAERSRRWGGDVRMCVKDTEFKIVDVKDCIARGFARMGFGEYDTGDQSSWTVRLTADGAPATGGASTAKALSAGSTN